MKKWIADHLILTWAIISVCVALVIHVLFSIVAPVDWLRAKWGAGEILTYISTIALGLLAMWQNQKFKSENDVLQQRLENLTIRANELNIISKIIEFETNNLSRLRQAIDDFSQACDHQKIATQFVGDLIGIDDEQTNRQAILVTAGRIEAKIDQAFFTLCRELRDDPEIVKDDNSPIKKSMSTYY